jgi:DNA-nicking Smr family endonuclease
MGEDDLELFRKAVAGARPLAQERHDLRPPPPRPRAAFRRADERAALDDSLAHQPDDLGVESGEELHYGREQVPAAVLKGLRRGRYAIEDELDLHGLTAVEAREALRGFLASASARRLSCVRIVHGKGRGSGPRGPVLKKSVNLWLRKHDAVLAFSSARPAQGGTGALCVLLRRST